MNHTTITATADLLAAERSLNEELRHELAVSKHEAGCLKLKLQRKSIGYDFIASLIYIGFAKLLLDKMIGIEPTYLACLHLLMVFASLAVWCWRLKKLKKAAHSQEACK